MGAPSSTSNTPFALSARKSSGLSNPARKSSLPEFSLSAAAGGGHRLPGRLMDPAHRLSAIATQDVNSFREAGDNRIDGSTNRVPRTASVRRNSVLNQLVNLGSGVV